ncbi:MAG TPA: TlpA disulfide reductase family protein [Kofleriaceae bacterium]|nr:TlpA disulfide reductase family protein [Kofleriaceae bacterium]
MEAARAAVKAGQCPGAQDGSELVGTQPAAWQLSEWQLPEWQLPEWKRSEPLTLEGLRGRVVVVRFWTTGGCPFCEKSMPALQALSQELRGEPVTFIGAYHDKPSGSQKDMTEALAQARRWGVTFPIAFDRQWRTLRTWWLASGHRHATSFTFVIGKDGRIAHVHPGPVYYPSDDPAAEDANRDYQALRRAILAALEA